MSKIFNHFCSDKAKIEWQRQKDIQRAKEEKEEIRKALQEKQQAVEDLREQVKQHTLETLKPEMAPWAKEYTPVMEDIQTKLTITKPHNTQGAKAIVEYQQLFQSNGKVWVKGGRGTGKTLLCKKIAYDWAKGIFTKFSLVFVVFCDLIGSLSSIEDAIVQQYDISDTQRKTLRYILDEIGNKCLVILDDVCPLLTRDISSNVSILVTSDMLHKCHIGSQVTTTYEIQGMMRKDAESLVTIAKEKADAILAVKIVVPPTFSTTENYNPMLVMFLCVLDHNKCSFAGNDGPSAKHSLNLCEIFLKLVMHLCKHSSETFCDYMQPLGRMAFESLQHGTKLSNQRVEIDSIPHSGMFVSHSAGVAFVHRTLELFLGALYFIVMINDGNSIDKVLDQDCINPMFMTNPLFLYFCLSLLKSQTDLVLSHKENVYEELKGFVVNKIGYAQIDLRDIAELYPTLNYAHVYGYKDELVLEFLNDIWSSCNKTKDLFLNHEFPVREILSAMGSTFSNLVSIIFVNQDEMIESGALATHTTDIDTSELNVILENQSVRCINELSKFLHASDRKYSLHYVGGNSNLAMMELSTFTQRKIRKLHIQQSVIIGFQGRLFSKSELPTCKFLTHLTMSSVHLQLADSLFKALSKAVQEEKMPNLSHLSFADGGNKLQNKIPLLFETQWPTLTHLDLTGCELDNSDIQIVLGATNPKQENLLPKLCSLAILPDYFTKGDEGNLLKQPWTSLTALAMVEKIEFSGHPSIMSKHVDNVKLPSFTEAINNGILPNLTDLRLAKFEFKITSLNLSSFASVGHPNAHGNMDLEVLASLPFTTRLFHLDLSYNGIADYLLYLLCDTFELLESLSLRGCGLTDQDMRNIAEANSRGYLPKLHHLDISYNNKASFKFISDFDNKWEQLKSLEVDWDKVYRKRIVPDLISMFQSGCFGSLQEVSFHIANRNIIPMERELCWKCKAKNLQREYQYKEMPGDQREILKPIADGLDQVQIPLLKTISIYVPSYLTDNATIDRQRIRSKGVSVYFRATGYL